MMLTTKLLLAAGAAAAVVIALQWNKIESQNTELDALQGQLRAAAQTNQQQLATMKTLKAQAETAARNARAVVARAPAPTSARPAPAAPTAVASSPSGASSQGRGLGSMMENMMKDPDMLKALAEQQAGMLRIQYAPLVKQLNLTPDQRDAFYKALSDNATNAMVQGMAMMSSTNNPDAASAVASSQKTMQDQMKALLGDSGFAQFQEFQTSLPDRMMFDQMKTGLADNPLTDDQQERLLQLMISERKNAAAAVDPGTGQPAVATANSAGAMEQAVQTQDQINQRVYQQAAGFLSPVQLESLGASQSNFLNLTKMTTTMMQKMMGTNNDDETGDQPGGQ
jgi:hypothetical protein